jgi:hypothetical protein
LCQLPDTHFSVFLYVVFTTRKVHILALVPATQQKRNSQGASTEGGTRSKTLRKNANFYTPHLTFWGTTFVSCLFYSFWSHLYVVFEYISFNISKNCRSTFLWSPRFKKVTLAAGSQHCYFPLHFLLPFNNKGLDISFQEQKQNQFISTGSVLSFFIFKKHFFVLKYFYTLLCALLKILKCIRF